MSCASDRLVAVAHRLLEHVLFIPMPTVDLNELQEAVDWASDRYMGNEAYICKKTGKIYWISGDGGLDDEDAEVPSDVDDPEKYIPVPARQELDIGTRLAFDFATLNLPERYDQIRDIFRHKGAYGRFKELLARSELLESWYAYSEERSLIAIREWCDSEELSVTE